MVHVNTVNKLSVKKMPDTPEKDSGVAEEPKEIETNGEVETNEKGLNKLNQIIDF